MDKTSYRITVTRDVRSAFGGLDTANETLPTVYPTRKAVYAAIADLDMTALNIRAAQPTRVG